MNAPSSEVVVDERQVERYIAALKLPAKAFAYCHPDTIKDLVSMLEELLRHRAEGNTANDWRHMNACIHGRSAEPCQKCAEIIARSHELAL